jgi:ketosteroid isomerase-like protein
MSQENVQLARVAFEHFRASGEPPLHLTAPEVEVRDHDIMDGEEYRGHEGVVRWLSDWAMAWSQFTMEPVEFIDAGDRVVVVLRMKATGRSSGVSIDRLDAMVEQWRDGKIVRLDYYNDRAVALRAVGLDEQA